MALEKYLSTHPKKYLIFDLDETLVWIDMNWNFYDEEQYKVIAKIDKEIADKTINNHQWRYVVNGFIKKYGEKAAKAIIDFNIDFERKNYLGDDKLNKELISFVKNNQGKYDFYLYTSNSKNIVNFLLEKYRLKNLFKKIVVREDVALSKPDPEGFYKIYKPGNDKKDYLMIGDSYPDAVVAKNAGIDYFEIKMKF